jgi:hypothetical protein
MYLRPSSSLRILTSLSYHLNMIRSATVVNIPNTNPHLLSPSLCQSQSQRTFMFWRANINRELYGTPNKALATRKRRRLQKTLTQIIRDGQLWRLLKESLLPEWNKWWKDIQPWDRRYSNVYI